jgi:hypothetical protein
MPAPADQSTIDSSIYGTVGGDAMSTHAAKSIPGSGREDGRAEVVKAQREPADAEHVDVVEAKLVQPVKTAESVLPPSPAEYSVEVAFQSPAKAPAPPPPVAAQRVPGVGASKLESEKVVVAAPLSFAGSAERIWKLVGLSDQTGIRILLGIAAVFLIALAWCAVLCWYLIWGLWLVPYRLIRRGARKRKREALQHREVIATIQDQKNHEDF